MRRHHRTRNRTTTHRKLPSGQPMHRPRYRAQFQMDIIVPRSVTENQWVMTRPQGGHPIPLNQPTRKFKTAITIMASDFCSGPKNCTGTIINIMDTAAKTNPNGRNTRALLAVGHASHQELGQSISYGIHRENDTQLSLFQKPNWAKFRKWPSRKFLRTI